MPGVSSVITKVMAGDIQKVPSKVKLELLEVWEYMLKEYLKTKKETSK